MTDTEPRPKLSREAVTTVLDILGVLLILAGVAAIFWPAALILAGLAALVVSWIAEGRPGWRRT